MAKKKAAKKTKLKPKSAYATEDEYILFDDFERKKRYLPAVPAMANVMSKLLTQRGYGQIQTTTITRELWNKVAGTKLAAHTRAGKIRGGVWEIFVRNSVVLQELSFQQSQLLTQIQQTESTLKVTRLNFKLGPMD